jgi:hypothetical protein
LAGEDIKLTPLEHRIQPDLAWPKYIVTESGIG